jgi:hypothetical protein
MPATEGDGKLKQTMNPIFLHLLHSEAVEAYRSGCRDAASLLSAPSLASLREAGITAQVIYDYAEDFSRSGSPTAENFVGVAEIRQAEFVGKMQGQWSAAPVPEKSLPPKSAEWAGIAWLPRITSKAQCFLEGSLAPEIMYGCSGDRAFLKEHGLTLPGFLAAVRDAQGDQKRVIDHVLSGAR